MKKVAFLIGNKDYQTLTPLDTPINDINSIGDSLKKYGFVVKRFSNLSKKHMEIVCKCFKYLYKTPGIYIFYFSGHGFSADGINYLAAIDAKLTSLQYTSIDINELFVHSTDSFSIIFIDACRKCAYDILSSPSIRSIRGNAVVSTMIEQEIFENTIISFSTSFGHNAFDTLDGTNMSPFAYFLNENLKFYFRDIYTLLNKVRIDMSTHNSKQIPVELVSLRQNLFLYDRTYLPANIYFLYNLINPSMACSACKIFPSYLWSSKATLIGILPVKPIKNISISLRDIHLLDDEDEIEFIYFDNLNFFITTNHGYLIYCDQNKTFSKYIINTAIFDIRYIPHKKLFALVSNSGLYLYHMYFEYVIKIIDDYIYALEISDDREKIYFFSKSSLYCYDIVTSSLHLLSDIGRLIFQQFYVYSIKRVNSLLICATSLGLLFYDIYSKDINLLTIDLDTFPGMVIVKDMIKDFITPKPINCYCCMDLSPDLNYVACGTNDGEIVIWDLKHKFALEPLVVSALHQPVTSIAWGYHGYILAIIEYKTLIAIVPNADTQTMNLSLRPISEISGFDSFSFLCANACELPPASSN